MILSLVFSNEGLLQRACQQLLNLVFQKNTTHTHFSVKFSAIAIYDELSVDLLG